MAYAVRHTFISPFKLCNVCLSSCFSLNQFYFNEWMSFLLAVAQSYGDCLKKNNLKTIWKSQHHHLVSAIALQKFFLTHFAIFVFFVFVFVSVFFFFLKKAIFMSNIPQYYFLRFIWHQYHFATNAYFSMISNSSIQRHPSVF